MDLFLLKKLIGALLMPLTIIMLLLIIAIIYHRKSPTFSLKCLCAGTIILILSSFSPVSDRLMAPIENNFPAFTSVNKPIDYIVILGCSHTFDENLPATSQLKSCSLQRLVEAVRIYRLHPEATIITSGGSSDENDSNAQAVKLAAISLGIPEQKIITENFPKDTEEEALLIAPRVKGSTVVLVTNADHMPRAINYFKHYGVDAIAAPAGHWVKGNDQQKSWGYYLPTSYKLEQTTTAWYESVGRLWQWLKSFMD